LDKNKFKNMASWRDNIVEQIKSIETDVVEKWDSDTSPMMKIVEEQKVYFWIRVYLQEERQDLEPGDDVIIKWLPSGEELRTKFVCYDKTTLTKDHDDLEKITNFNPEDDKKILCLMVEEKIINFSQEIPFIRTLFKNGIHYEYQLLRRDELVFIIDKNSSQLEWYDCSF